jgi:hypothetical protein
MLIAWFKADGFRFGFINLHLSAGHNNKRFSTFATT